MRSTRSAPTICIPSNPALFKHHLCPLVTVSRCGVYINNIAPASLLSTSPPFAKTAIIILVHITSSSSTISCPATPLAIWPSSPTVNIYIFPLFLAIADLKESPMVLVRGPELSRSPHLARADVFCPFDCYFITIGIEFAAVRGCEGGGLFRLSSRCVGDVLFLVPGIAGWK